MSQSRDRQLRPLSRSRASRKIPAFRDQPRQKTASDMGTAAMAQETATDLECRLAQAQRELSEAREQQAATSEILRVISTSPTDVQPVFETIVRNAVSLCGSLYANVFRFDGELLHFVAFHIVGPSYVELMRAKYPMR